MDILDKILKEHSVILEKEETRIEVYKIDEDIEIGVQQTKDSIYMYAYTSSKDKNISIKSNFKKLWDGFRKVAEDGYIKSKKGYTYTFNLKKVEYVEEVIEVREQVVSKDTLLEEMVHKLTIENDKLKAENIALKLEIYRCSLVNEHQQLGRKRKLSDEQLSQIKELNAEKGMSIRQLAKRFECSVGLIHKVLKVTYK